MSVSDNIRALAREGLKPAEIAKRLGIRYQHAYGVLKTDGALAAASGKAPADADVPPKALPVSKPTLTVDALLAGGFALSCRWVLSAAGEVVLDGQLPKAVGVYAFVKDGIARYIGVATMEIAKRLYFHAKPGVTQRTSLRLNGILKGELQTVQFIEIYTAIPPDFEWNGLPVHGSAGLELGLIKKYALPWNLRSQG